MENWLTQEQAKELLTVPDRSRIKGKRDYAILALLVGCALRRQEPASLDVDGIEMREGRWVLPDLCGKDGRVRTIAIPLWVKHGIDAWMIAAKIEDGRLLRPLSKSGKLIGDELGNWAIWSVVERCAKEIGIEHFGAHDLRRTCAKLCRKTGAIWNRSSLCLGIAPFKRRSVIRDRNGKSKSQSITISDSVSEIYFCNLRCLCVPPVQRATKPNLSVEEKTGAYSLTVPSGEEHQFAGIVDVARWTTATAFE